MRIAVLVTGLWLVATGAGRAQEARPWAEKLFTETGAATAHDFGTVAHGAQLFHKFTFRNPYAVPLNVAITRVSCSCATASLTAAVVQPRETAAVDVSMNGRLFKGPKSIRVYVTFSNGQFFSTGELQVSANARADVVFNPGEVNFGAVAQGQAASQAIDVEYAGVLDWQVREVVANGLPVQATYERLYQRPGQVGYRISVSLKPEAPAGLVKGELLVKTNDPASPLVPVLVEANVQAALTVAPATLRPALKVNEQQTVNVVVRGQKDFRILAVDGAGEGVSVATALPDGPSPTHRLTFRLQGGNAGEFRRKLQIRTDLQTTPVTVTVEGQVDS